MIDLDFTKEGIRYVNPGEYKDLSWDAYKCVALAQSEMLAVSVRVYQITKDFTGSIKGTISTVGKESVVQEVDPSFTPDPKIPHLIIHEKSLLNADVTPGDEVVIRYVDGTARVIPVGKDAKYTYDIELDGPPEALKRITDFLAKASNNGEIRLTADRIAEVVGNAVTNLYRDTRPESISVAVTEFVKSIDLKKESIVVSEKLLDAYESGYRVNLQASTPRQVVFVGTPEEVKSKRRFSL